VKTRTFVATAVACAAVVGTSAATASAVTLNGGGATFSQPLWQQTGANLKKKLTLNYQGIGSGAGVTQFANGTLDFAGSDPPLTDKQIGTVEAHGGPVVHVPVALGAITVSYNIPGIKSGLRLDGVTIANIYLGKITNWNNGAIKKLNPKAKLPNLPISVYRRSESSGTTAGFTLFLSKYSSEWASKAGPPGNTAKWPVGSGATGNAGVAAGVKQRKGAIGYVEQAYAVQNHFTYATVKNRKKQWIAPNLSSVSKAGSGLKVASSIRFTAIDSASKGAYPIVSQTFMVNHRNVCAQKGVDAAKASAIMGVINYLYGKSGTKMLNRLVYAQIPADLKRKVRKQLAKSNCNGKKIKAAKY
jgi:phosphate transport system substrate-binding protein